MTTTRIYVNTRKSWSLEEESRLKELVATGKYSYPELTVLFPGRSSDSLRCHARQYLDIHSCYRQHKYTYDSDFFTIPNVINSYVAGFLAADGCVQLSTKQSPVLTLSLSVKDVDHLSRIKSLLGYTGPIHNHTNRPKRPDNLVKGGLGMMTLQISVSEQYIKYLADNFGVIPRKTRRLKPPELSFENQLAYLIGLIDGDGYVCPIANRSNIAVGFISSSEEAAKWIKEFVDSLGFTQLKGKKVVNIGTRYEGRAFTIRYQGAQAIALIKLVQAFKQARGIPLLDRKWDNPKVNQHILDFEAKYPSFQYTPPTFLPNPI